MPDFLLEIGLEEVPARMLAGAQKELGERTRALLERVNLLAPGAALETFSTPRRLAVLVRNVGTKQPDSHESLTGPPWSIAFKNGEPTPAAYAFAKKAGVAVDQLEPATIAKGEYVSISRVVPGRLPSEILGEFIPREIAALSWPKPMYWRAGKPERFVRPVQWLVALLDEQIIPLEFAGVQAGRNTYGHRVLHGPAPVPLAAPAQYRDALHAAYVVANPEERRHIIRKALDRVTRTVEGARWREDEKLVETVIHLTEWPSVLLGSFAPEYLVLPEEVLVTVMRDHQKYFAVEDAQGKLLPHFLAVLNTEADERAQAIIRHGNERVLRARFSDARFFWNFDQRNSLEVRRSFLKGVIFQKDLGSYWNKKERTKQIAFRIMNRVKSGYLLINQGILTECVEFAKVDLTTDLVKEFTELQGIVGALYVRSDNSYSYIDREAVAQAIYWQYSPAAITDPIPPTIYGQILGLADRIGTIVDMFAIGLAPSGSKDPYALRRAANAIIKILAVSKLPISIEKLLAAARTDQETAPSNDVRLFLRERLSYYLEDVAKLPADAVNAVLAAGFDDVPDAQARAEALAAVRGSEDLLAISAAWKRTKNILRQANEKGIEPSPKIDENLLTDDAERDLAQAVAALIPQVEAFRGERNYRAALESIATLRPQVDRFFDKTMVMVADPALRANRLALLSGIVRELGRIADFSELTPPESAPA